MSSKDFAQRLRVVVWAREKFADRRIALVELDGTFTLRSYTGDWTLDRTQSPPFAREKTTVYWTGKSLDEAEQAVNDAKQR